jgi:hypothetical protein
MMDGVESVQQKSLVDWEHSTAVQSLSLLPGRRRLQNSDLGILQQP